jgi:sulfur-oxidizing protein SoxX
MPMPGSKHLQLTFLLSLVMVVPALAGQDPASALVPYRVDNDQIAAPLTGHPGDPVRGAALFANRQVSTCLLCHADPAAQTQANTIGPPLADVGARLSVGQIRLRIVDASRLNPDTVMPSFYVVDGLNRVGRQWRGKPILESSQIEDLVAYLAMQRSP